MTWTYGPVSLDEVLVVAASIVGVIVTIFAYRLRVLDARLSAEAESRYVARRRLITHAFLLAYHLLMFAHGGIRLTQERTPQISTETLIAVYLLPVASLCVMAATINDLDIRRGVRRMRRRATPRPALTRLHRTPFTR